jgi:hypothetical protein
VSIVGKVEDFFTGIKALKIAVLDRINRIFEGYDMMEEKDGDGGRISVCAVTSGRRGDRKF